MYRVGTGSSLGTNKDLVVDTSPPVVVQVSKKSWATLRGGEGTRISRTIVKGIVVQASNDNSAMLGEVTRISRNTVRKNRRSGNERYFGDAT